MKSQVQNLYRRTGITKESCFHAARRLDTHNTLSLWSLTTLAFSLIVISLITQLYADNHFIIEYERFLDFAITTLSVFAMVISVVVQKSDFSLRSDNFRRQAMEINELRISFRHLKDKDCATSEETEEQQELYETNSKLYSGILDRNLVHGQIDYYVSATVGVEHKYHFTKLVVTQYLGYLLIIVSSISLLAWSCWNTYLNTLLAT
ncbi:MULTISPECIES: SLATT domain-containing protein [Vibrio]|uniref:SLATT domain-containing protein n=1 Tax=Vibrio TaxID=662 RepID=UPI001E5C808D|nr:SLATT domain-containing protein [Vibrio sp. F13]MCC4888042.1 SLATT domain-containing protein [Vibrio sp. F13]